MAGFNPRRFGKPEVLRQIDPPELVRFLNPFAEFLAAHGLTLNTDAAIDCDSLAAVLLTPSPDMPAELVEALYAVHEMATDTGMHALLEAAAEHQIDLGDHDRLTPADTAVRVWNAARPVLLRRHTEQQIQRRKSFESFLCPDPGRAPAIALDGERIRSLESALAAHFSGRKRGRSAEVLAFSGGPEVLLVIRHGGLYRREGSLNDGRPGTVHYRPADFDVVAYRQDTGELRINAANAKDRDVYRDQVSLHLFGRSDVFPMSKRYTLEPLRDGSPLRLACADVPGIEKVTVKAVRLRLSGGYNRWRTEEADDLMACMAAGGERFPFGSGLEWARFEFRFTGARAPRSVVVRKGNSAQFTRDEDSLPVEEWLRRRGFVDGQVVVPEMRRAVASH